MTEPSCPALRLLLACARGHPSQADRGRILALLDEEPDWTQFIQKALQHGLAELVGHALLAVASDKLPEDVAHGFRVLIEETRNKNKILLGELFEIVDRLRAAGVDPICFKGPVLAVQAFGDLGLRGFRDLDILIRDQDQSRALHTLVTQGYARHGMLTEAQFGAIHRLQGQEILFRTGAAALEPHTRLTPLKMGLSIDYDGLWRRARLEEISGRTLLVFSPEDAVLVLAIHGGKELWWDIKWACDVADFITAHPGLDWNAIIDRARRQGCHRMLLVAVALAHDHLGAAIPQKLISQAGADVAVREIISRILARWEMDDPGGPPSNKTLSQDRLLLHDGLGRRFRYVMRTLLLPGPEHVTLARLPPMLFFLYAPIGLAHDLVALPFYRAYQSSTKLAALVSEKLAGSAFAAALTPSLSERRKRKQLLQQLLAKISHSLLANPRDSAAWTRKGEILARLGKWQEAIESFDKALRITPEAHNLWRLRARAVSARKGKPRGGLRLEEPELDPGSSEGWTLRAGFLAAQKNFAASLVASDQALRLDPHNEIAMRIGINCRQKICDWSRREQDKALVRQALQGGNVILRPINFKQVFDSPEDSLALARIWTRPVAPAQKPLWQGERYGHARIRIGYLSTDFRTHAVGNTVAELFEHHDRSRFEITAISFGPDDQSRTRSRIQAAVDRFEDASSFGDSRTAALIREAEIDIAVDLNGLTGGRRTGALALRPAPLQVNYLGYPGTMAATHIDYIIADGVVLPGESARFYSEKIARFPDCYLPSDTSRQISARPPLRQDQGLPDQGLVFACFNTTSKITPEIFDIWMRLLKALDDSVLWLAKTDAATIENLRKEAAARGVAPHRLVFARYEEKIPDHLARHALADLFLDTNPYNAHSTGNDALWSGLPILTCRGADFQSRVAASLLTSLGLKELITDTLSDYEELALRLARDPQELARLRQKLARNRTSLPLFDSKRYAANLEGLYQAMWERQQAGLPPDHLALPGKQFALSGE